MSTRKGSIVLIIFCGLLMALCWQTPARAASTPPPIGDIVGTYVVTDKDVYYYFDEGKPVKDPVFLTWRITQTSDTTVQVQIDEWNWPFTAYYKNGFLVQSCGGISASRGNWGGMGIALFSGSLPKVKFKGNFGFGQFGLGGEEDFCQWDPHTGKMVSTDPGFVVTATLASQDDERAVFDPEEGTIPLAAAPPLTIDDLVGTYSCSLSGTQYNLTPGAKLKGKATDTLTISKIDDTTLRVASLEGTTQAAHYGGHGVLMIADFDSSDLDPNAGFAIFFPKGKPGKISLKGKALSAIDLDTPPTETFQVIKVSCKQTGP